MSRAGTLRRPGMRARDEGSFLTNPGVLVTYVRTPSPPDVGLRSCVRMRVPFGLFASGWRRNSCGSARRRSRGPRLPRRRSCRQLRRRALPAGIQMPCFCLRHAVRQGKNKLTWVVPGDKPPSNSDVEGVVSRQWLQRWRERQWGEDDGAAPKTLSPHATWPQPAPVPATCGVRRGRRRRTADVPSSLHTTMPKPGDHSPCMPCLSFVHAFGLPAGVYNVGVWVSAWVRVWVHGCLCVRAHVCACTYRRDCPRTSMLSR
jgi:hypothetical protein